MKLKHCLFIFGFFLSIAVFAQEFEPLDLGPIGFDVCGIEMGQKLPHSEFVAKFGTPDKYRSYETEFGLDEDYHYGQNWFHCSEGGHITNYALFDRRFAVLTKELKDGIRVGDNLEKMSSYKQGKMCYRETDSDGNDVYMLSETDVIFILVVKNYVIVSIICDYPV